MNAQPEAFAPKIADEAIADLRERLARTRLPDQAPGDPWAYGTNVEYLRGLLDYWRTGFDWRAQEARLNAFPQFKGRCTTSTCISCTCRAKARTRARFC